MEQKQTFIIGFYYHTDCRATEIVKAYCYITALAIAINRNSDYAAWPLTAGFSIKIKIRTKVKDSVRTDYGM